MQLLKQSTAATVQVGPVLDASGAAVTNAVVADFQLTKNGTTAALASPATATHSHNGYYLIALTTGNTDTVGRLDISVNNAAQSVANHRYMVLLASVFDAIVTNVTNTTGGLATATSTITALGGAISTLTAAGVRTELATELGRIDAAVSSRMATYTQPTGFLSATFPTTVSSLTAAGVRTELATELGRIDVAVSTRSTFAGGAVASVTGNVGGNVVGSVGSIAGVTFPAHFNDLEIEPNGHVSAIVQSIANNAITANSIQGGAITAAKFATDAITATAIAADAVTEIQFGLATSGALSTAQADLDNIQTRLPATLIGGRMDSNVQAIDAAVITAIQFGLATSAALSTAQADLDNIQTRLPSALIGGRMDSNVQAIDAAVIAAIQSGLSTLTSGQVNAEVVDALNVDTYAEPGSVPPALATLVQKINWLYLLARNKLTQTASTQTVFADNQTTPVSTATVSDDGTTATRGEFT